MEAKTSVAGILRHAGITLDGNQPWDVKVHNDKLYRRVLAGGSMAVGESYMDGWWDVEKLDEFFTRVHIAQTSRKLLNPSVVLLAIKSKLLNRQTHTLSKKVAQEHYDLGNDLYQTMLDKRMQYTCAYWKTAKTLEQAQYDKLKLIAKKLELKPGMRVLELGGGFGGLAYHLAKENGCQVVTYNISKEQVAFGRELCKGLPVRFEQKDYREAVHELGQFDRVVSIGLCEHIGPKNYLNFLSVAHAKLKDGGLFLLHTIGGNKSLVSTEPWIDKYIFPNGVIPSIQQLGKANERLFVMEDWHNFGPDYDKTLMAWDENFRKGYEKLNAANPRYDARFYRMWRYYLMASAGGFRSRQLQLWQIVFSKARPTRYDAQR